MVRVVGVPSSKDDGIGLIVERASPLETTSPSTASVGPIPAASSHPSTPTAAPSTSPTPVERRLIPILLRLGLDGHHGHPPAHGRHHERHHLFLRGESPVRHFPCLTQCLPRSGAGKIEGSEIEHVQPNLRSRSGSRLHGSGWRRGWWCVLPTGRRGTISSNLPPKLIDIRIRMWGWGWILCRRAEVLWRRGAERSSTTIPRVPSWCRGRSTTTSPTVIYPWPSSTRSTSPVLSPTVVWPSILISSPVSPSSSSPTSSIARG